MAEHPSVENEPTGDLVKSFTKWTADNFIYIHPSLRFVQSSGGHDVYATSEIPPNTNVLSSPFSMAITAPQSKDALVTVLQGDKTTVSDVLNRWSERQVVCVYMILHRLWKEIKNSLLPPVLKHKPYLDMLPPSNVLLTTMYFSQEEMDLLKGSNLYQATITRNQEWRAEWQACIQGLSALDADLGGALTWEYYLEAATHLSSRAFPSTILSKTPSNTASNLSHAVLLPGIDSLNHKRATPVSWVANVSEPLGSSTLDLLIHETVPAGAECFNNYGPKPNSELILGYGFALPSNPDDTILLSLATSNAARGSMVEIGRDAKNAERLWELVVAKISELGSDEPISVWEIELEAAETIISLTEQRLARLPDVSQADGANARKIVLEMIGYYLEGQRTILTSLIQWAQAKRLEVRDNALTEGIELLSDYEEEE
ncbi:SET domain protein [Rhizoctonia solani AG-3 Rhs1AP]|uniref:SET domain protein n=1 Tax=Rhizoctonia solani AG-3 Rhs1AP TaxID=1086054 RepID=X8JVK3_9AGAM|nr:SET domain protein [Rhizoctonia solani AG-3 Rhs1AP]